MRKHHEYKSEQMMGNNTSSYEISDDSRTEPRNQKKKRKYWH